VGPLRDAIDATGPPADGWLITLGLIRIVR
jgi:hypothetical protein